MKARKERGEELLQPHPYIVTVNAHLLKEALLVITCNDTSLL